MSKRIYKMTLSRWMRLTPEEWAQYREYVAGMNMDLGIFCDEDDAQLQRDAQADHDEYIEEMSIGGRPFKGD